MFPSSIHAGRKEQGRESDLSISVSAMDRRNEYTVASSRGATRVRAVRFIAGWVLCLCSSLRGIGLLRTRTHHQMSFLKNRQRRVRRRPGTYVCGTEGKKNENGTDIVHNRWSLSLRTDTHQSRDTRTKSRDNQARSRTSLADQGWPALSSQGGYDPMMLQLC